MKILSKTILIIGIIVAFFAFIIIFIPNMKEPLVLITNGFFVVLKNFFLESFIKHIILFFVIVSAIQIIFGYKMSKKTKNHIWIVVASILEIVEVISLYLHFHRV